MMAKLQSVDVFTPSDFPAHTYVARDEEKLENQLRQALATPGEVISISGPSKSGKTVLVEKVVGRDNLIIITGAGIESPELLWDRVLDWMDIPSSTSTTTTTERSRDLSATVEGELSIPLVGKGSLEGGIRGGLSRSTTSASAAERRGLPQVLKEIAGSDFVLLIDDFHYMNRDVQAEVAMQIKEAARLHTKICTASVPHRADDVVRSNPELRGRVRAIDIDYWKPPQLKQIAFLGFNLLNAGIPEAAVTRFAEEASGSPQLMQAICLQACFELSLREELSLPTPYNVPPDTINLILRETSSRTDFASLVRNMHAGPKTRGTERKDFQFRDGTRGDVYRCVLLAVASDPPSLSLDYNELTDKIRRVCTDETPQPTSVYQACGQVSRMALDMYPAQRVIEWDEGYSLLDIIDPYFLFYIRWSGKLASLASP